MGASDSKLAFKQSIFGLAGRDDIPHGDPLWTSFYTLPESTDDVFSLWSPNDIGCLTRSNKDNRPPPDTQVEPNKNLETLVYILIARLRTLQDTHVYMDNQRATNSEILNCMRILTRMMPFINEAQHIQEWGERFFWEPRKPTYFWDKKRDKPGQMFDGLDPSITYPMEDFDLVIGPPLMETLLNLMVRYIFFAGFTVPQRYDAEGKPDLELIVKVWQTGIGSSRSAGCTREHERNQQETVRLLLSLFSQTLYVAPNEVATLNVKSLTYMTTRLDKRLVNGILCSLLNTVLRYNPNLWSVPIDMATGSADSKKLLVTNCVQLVLVLILYDPPDSPTAAKNLFRQSLGSLHRPDDFQFIQQGISLVLAQPVSGTFNYSLNKEKALPWAPEMLSLLWELVQCNKRFKRCLVQTSGALDMTVLALFYALDAKDDPSKHGILRLCVFFLQDMSIDSLYAERLNHVFRHPETLPAVMRIQNFHGSYADFLISSIHTIFTTTKGRLESVYPALLCVLENIAPYQKNIARATGSKMRSLIEVFGNPSFLLASDSNKDLLVAMVRSIDLFLGNNLSENRRLVEVLVASRGRFEALQRLTLEGSLAELDRIAQERKERGDALSLSNPASRTTSLDSVRSPTSSGRALLRDVPEDDRFAIGDDDAEVDEDEVRPRTTVTDGSESATSVAGQGSLSERARGKRPATVSVSPLSRNPSAASLPSINTAQTTNTSQTQFRPTQDWLDSWFPRSQLDNILRVIHLAETKQLRFASASNNGLAAASAAAAPSIDVSGTSAQGESSQRGHQARSDAGQSTPTTAHGPDGQGHLRIADDREGKGFQWTAVAIGWYAALIWSRIYLCEAESHQGTGALYSSTNVLLFRRSETRPEISLRSPRGAIDAVGNSLAQRISSISMK